MINYIDPSTQSSYDETTYILALKQTAAARALLYFPSEDSKKQLSIAASNIQKVLRKLSPEAKDELCYRSVYKDGVFPVQKINLLENAIERVRKKQGTGKENAALMALISDFDWVMTDSKNKNIKDEIRYAVNQTANLEYYSKEQRKNASRLAGSKTVAYGKKFLSEIKYHEGIKKTRGGIHDVSDTVDDLLGIVENKRINKPTWKFAEIDSSRVTNMQEPMVNQMSGSPLMTLIAFDMLTGENTSDQFVSAHNYSPIPDIIDENLRYGNNSKITATTLKKKINRAALAASYLIGSGFHSAVENVEGILAYTGQSLRNIDIEIEKDAGHIFQNGAATSLLSELMVSCCSEEGKKRFENINFQQKEQQSRAYAQQPRAYAQQPRAYAQQQQNNSSSRRTERNNLSTYNNKTRADEKVFFYFKDGGTTKCGRFYSIGDIKRRMNFSKEGMLLKNPLTARECVNKLSITPCKNQNRRCRRL